MNRLFSLFLLSIVLLSVNSNAFHVSVPIASIPKEAQTQESQLQEQDVPPLPSGQSSTNYEILTTSGDSVTITQTVLPIKNDGYLSGDTARIFVEIKNNKRIKKDRDLKGLAIRVILDDELGVVPDSARWLKVYSLDDLCKIKTELYTCPLDESPLITDANKCQNNIKQEYELFSYNDTKLNCIEEVKSIVNKISNIYDINWMGTDTPKIYQFNNFFIINNSNNDSYAIFSGQKNDIIRVDFSDGRSYNLSINTKNNTTYINYTNTIIGFRVDELSPKDSIIFYYDVKPKITGIFNVEIIARTYDPELSHLQDHTFFSKIEVKESNPKFEIKSRPSSTEVCTFGAWNPDTQKYPNFIDVYYDITYLGGASEPYCDNISIKFDPPTKERFYINENGIRDDNISNEYNLKKYSKFYMYETISIPLRVAFSTKSSYPLPGLSVNGIHYSFNEERINADTWIFKHLDIIFLLVATISLFFTAFELVRTRGELRDLSDAELIMSKNDENNSTIKLGKNIGDKKPRRISDLIKLYSIEIVFLVLIVLVFVWILYSN